MRKPLLHLGLLGFMVILGCAESQTSAPNTDQDITAVGECVEEPPVVSGSGITDIDDLNDVAQVVQATARAGEYSTYRFQASVGERLLLNTETDLCHWLYDPNSNLVSGTDISENGNYLLIVSPRAGLQSFDLALSLVDPNATPEPTPAPTSPPTDLPTLPPTAQETPPPPIGRATTAPPQQTSIPEPVEVFQLYIEAIRRGNYAQAWVHLSPEAQEFWEGFSNFQIFWNGFRTVEYRNLRFVDSIPNGMWLESDLSLIRHNNTPLDGVDRRFYFVWNPDANAWQFALSPRQYIIYYFRNINRQNYQYTWDRMTPEFRPQNFQRYREWWQSVAFAEVGNTELLGYLRHQATVQVTLGFTMRAGNRSTETFTYDLHLDPEGMSWKFAAPLDS